MVKQNFLTKMLLLCALIVGSSSVWAQSEVTIASFSASDYNGGTTNNWTVSNAVYATSGGGYYQLLASNASIVTPSINWSNYTDITITISARKYGGPNTTQGKISVSQGATELASYSPSGTSIVASSALSISPTDGTITISCPGASSSKGCGVQSIVIKGKQSSTATATTTTINSTGITNTDVYVSTTAGTLSAAVTAGGDAVSGATVTWSSSNTGVATIDASTGAVTLVAKGKTTITASYAGNATYQSSSATYVLEVTNSDPNAIQEAWVLTDLADLTANDVFVIVGNNGSNYAMSNDKGTGAGPSAVAVTIENDKITSTVVGNIKWNISGNATDGYTFYPDGSTTTWLYCTGDNNGVRVGTTNTDDYDKFKIDDNYIYNIGRGRYLGIFNSQDWRCYTSINSNITGQSFAFYKKVNFVALTSAKEYVSFSSPYALDFTDTGLTAYVVSDETATSVTLTEVSKVPANTGLVLKGTAETNYTVPLLSGDAETFTNKLLGTGTDGVTDLTSKSVYVLSDGKFKVYTGTEIAGGKAYLPKTSDSEAPSLSFDFGEGTTGIQNIERTINDNQYYTLDGRRVAQPTKGLYIVNGKKVVIK